MNIIDMLNLTGKRRPSFEIMLNHLSTKNCPLIVETGCARIEDNFNGDGMSTLIFDEYVATQSGKFFSVDISLDNVKFAKSKVRSENTTITCSDSVLWLHERSKEWETKIDLLYLDSYDFDMANPHPSSLHHILELVAIRPCLKEGTMICVDDNFGNIGKGSYVKQFMDLIDKPMVFNGYQWIWIL